jgi:hypothetical protein
MAVDSRGVAKVSCEGFTRIRRNEPIREGKWALSAEQSWGPW